MFYVDDDGSIKNVRGGREFICVCSAHVENSIYYLNGPNRCPFYMKFKKSRKTGYWNLENTSPTVSSHAMCCVSKTDFNKKNALRILPIETKGNFQSLNEFKIQMSRSGFHINDELPEDTVRW